MHLYIHRYGSFTYKNVYVYKLYTLQFNSIVQKNASAAYLCCPCRIGYDPRLASLANRGDINGWKPTLWSLPPGKLAWLWKIQHLKMHFLFKMGISIAMLVYQSVHFHPDESANLQLLLLLSSFQLIFQVFLLLFLCLTLLAHVLETKNAWKSKSERCRRQIMRKIVSIPILQYWFVRNPHIGKILVMIHCQEK